MIPSKHEVELQQKDVFMAYRVHDPFCQDICSVYSSVSGNIQFGPSLWSKYSCIFREILRKSRKNEDKITYDLKNQLKNLFFSRFSDPRWKVEKGGDILSK